MLYKKLLKGPEKSKVKRQPEPHRAKHSQQSSPVATCLAHSRIPNPERNADCQPSLQTNRNINGHGLERALQIKCSTALFRTGAQEEGLITHLLL